MGPEFCLFPGAQCLVTIQWVPYTRTFKLWTFQGANGYLVPARSQNLCLQHQAWVKFLLAFSLLLLMILQLCHLALLLPLPVNNSSCLFTWCQPLYASYYTLLFYISSCCTVRFKIFIFLWVFKKCVICVKRIINLLQDSTILSAVLVGYIG